ILGSNGADVLFGGDGDDFIDGNQGNDTAFLGAGDDVFQWDPGDGSDVVDGQDGSDQMLFNGANIAENIDVTANGPRVLVTRNVGTVTTDLGGIEQIHIAARGGVANITVHDLSGTDVTEVNLNLESTPGSGVGDGAIDTVIVKGTGGGDDVQVVGGGASYSVVGLAALVNVTGSE